MVILQLQSNSICDFESMRSACIGSMSLISRKVRLHVGQHEAGVRYMHCKSIANSSPTREYLACNLI